MKQDSNANNRSVIVEQINAYSGELRGVKQQYATLASLEGIIPTITLVNPVLNIPTITFAGPVCSLSNLITVCPIDAGATLTISYPKLNNIDIAHQGIYLGNNVIVGNNYSGLSSHIIPYNVFINCDVAIKKTKEEEIADLWIKFKQTRNVHLLLCIKKTIADKKAELNKKMYDIEFKIKELVKKLGCVFVIDHRNGYRKIIRFLFKALDDDSDESYSIGEFASIRFSISNYLNKIFYEEKTHNTIRYRKVYSGTRQDVKFAQA